MFTPFATSGLRYQLTGNDQGFLVGQRDVFTRIDGSQRRAKTGVPDQGREHEFDVLHLHTLFQCIGPCGIGLDARREEDILHFRQSRSISDRYRVRLELQGLFHQQVHVVTAGEQLHLETIRICSRTTSSAWVPIEPVEPRMAIRFCM